MIRFILKEDILEDKEHCKDVHDGRDIFPLLASKIENDVRDHAERDAFRDAVEEGHGDDAEISGDRGRVVILRHFDVGNVAEHQKADDDERGSRCKRGDCREDGGEEHGDEEEDRGNDRGKTGSAACRNAGSRLYESGGRGGTENRACGGRNCVCHQSGLDLGKSAVFIEHICFRADTDERAEGIEKVNEKEGEDHDDEIEDTNAVHINVKALADRFAELREIRKLKGRVEGIEACRRIGNVDARKLAEHTETPRCKDTDQDRALDVFHVEDRREKRTDNGKERADADGIEVFREINDGNERGAVYAKFCVLQADKGDEKTDTDGDRVFELERDRVEDRFSDVCERKHDEDQAFNEYGKERDLP